MSTLCAVCSSPLEEGSHFCVRCGSSVSGKPGAAVSTPPAIAEPVPFDLSAYRPGNGLEGIGGWLILPAIGLAISPLFSIHGIIKDMSILTGATHQYFLSTHPAMAGLILFEAITNIIFLLAAACLNFLFYSKKKIFPKSMIAYLVIIFVLLLADHLMAGALSPSANHTSGLFSVIRAFLQACIWIPYFLNSERVEQTFVH
ncbi:MAG: DUF2569 domain-containing protein [Terracidiphilus sp.]